MGSQRIFGASDDGKSSIGLLSMPEGRLRQGVHHVWSYLGIGGVSISDQGRIFKIPDPSNANAFFLAFWLQNDGGRGPIYVTDIYIRAFPAPGSAADLVLAVTLPIDASFITQTSTAGSSFGPTSALILSQFVAPMGILATHDPSSEKTPSVNPLLSGFYSLYYRGDGLTVEDGQMIVMYYNNPDNVAMDMVVHTIRT